MNYSEEHLDQLLEASGERWRASEPQLEPFSVATLLRQRQGRPSLNHFVGSAWPLAAVLLATVALLALFVAGPLGPPQQTVAPPPASPTPGGWPPALYVENRGGPAFTVSINGVDVATVVCDGGPTIAPGTSGVPQLPWDLVVTRDQDGRQLLAQQVTDLPRWFVQIGDQPLGLSDNVVMGPIPPSCAPSRPSALPSSSHGGHGGTPSLSVIEAINKDPVNFASCYIDQDGALVILYVGANAGRAPIDGLLTPDDAVRWRQVARSWADLMTIVDQIGTRAQAGDSSLVDVFAISIDTINNQVEVMVGPPGSADAVSRGLASYGDAVRVTFSSDLPVVH